MQFFWSGCGGFQDPDFEGSRLFNTEIKPKVNPNIEYKNKKKCICWVPHQICVFFFSGRKTLKGSATFDDWHPLPQLMVCVAVAVVLGVSAVPGHPAGAFLDPRLWASPIEVLLITSTHPPRVRGPVCWGNTNKLKATRTFLTESLSCPNIQTLEVLIVKLLSIVRLLLH